MLAAYVEPLVETRDDAIQGETLVRTVLERFQAYLNLNLASPPFTGLAHIREPGVLADAIAPLMPRCRRLG
jgi:hypothetical protein